MYGNIVQEILRMMIMWDKKPYRLERETRSRQRGINEKVAESRPA